jgi:hypothetical protein
MADTNNPIDVQVLAALKENDVNRVVMLLIDHWSELPPQLRSEAFRMVIEKSDACNVLVLLQRCNADLTDEECIRAVYAVIEKGETWDIGRLLGLGLPDKLRINAINAVNKKAPAVIEKATSGPGGLLDDGIPKLLVLLADHCSHLLDNLRHTAIYTIINKADPYHIGKLLEYCFAELSDQERADAVHAVIARGHISSVLVLLGFKLTDEQRKEAIRAIMEKGNSFEKGLLLAENHSELTDEQRQKAIGDVGDQISTFVWLSKATIGNKPLEL